MVNQQLVEYIKQQLQAGVSKDAVSKALGDAGWAAADIDDSIKAAEPAGGMAAAASPASQQTINPVVAMGGSDVAAKPAGASAASDRFFSSSKPVTAAQAVDDDDDEHPQVKKLVITTIALGAVILLLAGALAFVYFNLNGQLQAAQGGGGNPAEVASLQQQVNQLNSDKNTLTTQMQALSAENQTLLDELGFVAAASGTSTAPVSATVTGMLSGNASTTFALTTTHNVKVFVANSKDANVASALTPLANGTAPVTLSGTHAPASPNLTVTSVNGTAL